MHCSVADCNFWNCVDTKHFAPQIGRLLEAGQLEGFEFGDIMVSEFTDAQEVGPCKHARNQISLGPNIHYTLQHACMVQLLFDRHQTLTSEKQPTATYVSALHERL